MSEPIQHRFNPYNDNGGTVLGIAGKDFCILAGDTRHSSGFSIQSRFEPRLFDLGDNIVFSGTGFSADSNALMRNLKANMEWYHHDHNKSLSIKSCARLIQQKLYGKRFFPYYVSTIIGGLDENGRGALFSYDPVGSYQREQCRSAGSASSLIMPVLDNQVNFKNMYEPDSNGTKRKQVEYLELEEALKLVKDAFSSATERHIYVGDTLQIMVITKDGINEQFYPLKRD